MTRNDIIKLARKAGLANARDETDLAAFVLRFAALVAAAEREACAQMCDDVAYAAASTGFITVAMECAAAIRARGQA